MGTFDRDSDRAAAASPRRPGRRSRDPLAGVSNAALSRRLARQEQPTGLLVADDAPSVESHQMKVSAFRAEIRTRAIAAARDELGPAAAVVDVETEVGRELAPYSAMTPAALEQALKTQAPETAQAKAARDYIEPVVQRVRGAVRERRPQLADAPQSLASAASAGVDKLKSWGKALFSARPGAAGQPAPVGELGDGAPLDGQLRTQLEPMLGDLSDVSVHTGPQAGAEADRLGARAFALGSTIAFAPGEYKPGTVVGDALIAHELAHVVQQADASGPQLAPRADTSTSDLERDADETAAEVVTALHAGGPARRIGRRMRSATSLARCSRKVPEPEPPAPVLPDLKATTSASYFNIRKSPGEKGEVLGALQGQAVAVTVSDKQQLGDGMWYAVTLKAPVGALPAGQFGWVHAKVLADVETPWAMFRKQLGEWERSEGAALDQNQKITRLRQMCHTSDLPFDEVIGAPRGPQYADDRKSTQGKWDLLRDSQAVRMPDGSLVDVYHLLVGLDVLHRPNENTRAQKGPFVLDVGQNYSAATWAGDVGAAAVDGWLRFDEVWEKHNAGMGLPERRQRYFDSRVSGADILGDVDAWGVEEIREAGDGTQTVEALLAAFYEPTPAKDGGAPAKPPRRRAVEAFLRKYGLNTTGGPLKIQPASKKMAEQVYLFALMWRTNRAPKVSSGKPVDSELSFQWTQPMTDMFLDRVQQLAEQNGAKVP